MAVPGNKRLQGPCIETKRVDHAVHIAVHSLELTSKARFLGPTNVVVVGDELRYLRSWLDRRVEDRLDASIFFILEFFLGRRLRRGCLLS